MARKVRRGSFLVGCSTCGFTFPDLMEEVVKCPSCAIPFDKVPTQDRPAGKAVMEALMTRTGRL